nr:aspyridones efflux protein apdf [Quercus suber]
MCASRLGLASDLHLKKLVDRTVYRGSFTHSKTFSPKHNDVHGIWISQRPERLQSLVAKEPQTLRRVQNGLQDVQTRDVVEQQASSIPSPPAPQPPGLSSQDVWKAWRRVAGAWLLFIVAWGPALAYGSFQTYYKSNPLSSYSDSTIAWIGSLGTLLLVCAGALAGPLFDRGYLKHILVLGCLVLVFSLEMLSLCTEYYQLVLAQGVGYGLGSGLVYVPALAFVTSSFPPKTRPYAVGVLTSGAGLAGVLYPIIFDRLVIEIGFGWTCRFLGFFSLLLAGIGLLLVWDAPIKSTKPRSLVDWKAFTEVPFMSMCLVAFFQFLGYCDRQYGYHPLLLDRGRELRRLHRLVPRGRFHERYVRQRQPCGLRYADHLAARSAWHEDWNRMVRGGIRCSHRHADRWRVGKTGVWYVLACADLHRLHHARGDSRDLGTLVLSRPQHATSRGVVVVGSRSFEHRLSSRNAFILVLTSDFYNLTPRPPCAVHDGAYTSTTMCPRNECHEELKKEESQNPSSHEQGTITAREHSPQEHRLYSNCRVYGSYHEDSMWIGGDIHAEHAPGSRFWSMDLARLLGSRSNQADPQEVDGSDAAVGIVRSWPLPTFFVQLRAALCLEAAVMSHPPAYQFVRPCRPIYVGAGRRAFGKSDLRVRQHLLMRCKRV